MRLEIRGLEGHVIRQDHDQKGAVGSVTIQASGTGEPWPSGRYSVWRWQTHSQASEELPELILRIGSPAGSAFSLVDHFPLLASRGRRLTLGLAMRDGGGGIK